MMNKANVNAAGETCQRKKACIGLKSKRLYSNRYHTSIFIASLLLVLSGGGFSQRNGSYQSCSEAFATTFSHGSTVNPRNTNNRRSDVSTRGGSSSLLASTEDDLEEKKVNGKSIIKKFNGINGYKNSNNGVNGVHGIRRTHLNGEKFYDSSITDQQIPTHYIAETNLPTDVGHFRLRAYRVDDTMHEIFQNLHVGTEPCVIYSSAKPPFGQKDVPVRIHDQCFTSEVFRSQR
jgi:hypothetical protein